MTFILLAGLLAYAAQAADAFCPLVDPAAYLVYSLGDIRYARSDFEGPVGAAGSIALERFHLGDARRPECLAAVAGRDVQLRGGTVYASNLEVGGALALRDVGRVTVAYHGGDLRLTNSRTRGVKSVTGNVAFVQAGGVDRYFLERSRCFASRAGEPPFVEGALMRFAARPRGLTIFYVGADQLAAAGELEFAGERGSLIVVNVRGRAASVWGKHVVLRGVGPGQVLLHFVDAETLTLGATGIGDFGLVGLPASVLAPRARVSFENGLLTGQLVAGALEGGLAAKPGGQVNASYFAGWAACCPPEMQMVF